MLDISTVAGSLEKWSGTAIFLAGLLMLIGFLRGALDRTGLPTIAWPEWVSALIMISSMLLLFIGLVGLYPYIADRSPRLALSGAWTAAIGGAVLIVAVTAGILLDLMGVIGFTEGENNPVLLGLFFGVMILFFLTLVLNGIASVRTKRPSRIVGLLLLVPIVEPGSVLVMDLIGIDLGFSVALATLGIAGISIAAAGYLIRAGSTQQSRPQTDPDVAP